MRPWFPDVSLWILSLPSACSANCISQGSNCPSALILARHPVHKTSTAKPEERVHKNSESHWKNTRCDGSTIHRLRPQGGQYSSASLACCPPWPAAKIQVSHGNAIAPSIGQMAMLSCRKWSFRVWTSYVDLKFSSTDEPCFRFRFIDIAGSSAIGQRGNVRTSRPVWQVPDIFTSSWRDTL